MTYPPPGPSSGPHTGPPPGPMPGGPAPGYPPPRPMPMERPADPTLAEWWQRLVARIIDGFVLGILSIPVYVVYMIWLLNRMFQQLDQIANTPVGQEPPPTPMLVSPVQTLLFSFGIAAFVGVLGFFYDWLCHARWGMTLGKRILKLKLVRADDRGKVSAGAAAKRALAYPLPAVVPLLGSAWALVDVIWIFVDHERRQCLHDRFATTLVIKTDPPRPRPMYGPPPGHPYPGHPAGPGGPGGPGRLGGGGGGGGPAGPGGPSGPGGPGRPGGGGPGVPGGSR